MTGQRRRRKLKTWIYFPLSLVLVAIITLIFILVRSIGGKEKKIIEATPLPTPIVAVVPTPEPIIRLVPFKENGVWGFKNQNGSEMIPAIYTKVISFSEGFAFVADASNKYCIIDQLGNKIGGYEYEDAKPFKNSYAAVKVGDKWGYVNTAASMVIPAQYDNASSFSGGYAVVGKGSKFVYIDKDLLSLFSGDAFDYASDFVETANGVRAFVGIKDSQGVMEYKMVDKTTTIRDLRKIRGTVFSGELAAVQLESGTYVYYDSNGNEASPKTFDEARAFSEGFAAVKSEGKWGYINQYSDMVIPPQFDEALEFKEGYAPVKGPDGWYFINTEGAKLALNGQNAVNAFSQVEPFENGYAIVRKDQNVNILDKSGNLMQLYVADFDDIAKDYMGKVKTGSGSLKIRKEPSKDAAKLGEIPNGAQVHVTETLGEWCKVEYQGIVGYAFRQYILTEDAQSQATETPTESSQPS